MLPIVSRLVRSIALPTIAFVILGASAVRGAAVPTDGFSLGTVQIPVSVQVGGKRLSAGTYQLRMTGEQVEPAVPGQSGRLERWVEYRQGETVVARAVGIIVPADKIAQVAGNQRPPVGEQRVDRLKSGDYLRVWFNHQGDHILLHHPIVDATASNTR
jgi:hypothetical protein